MNLYDLHNSPSELLNHDIGYATANQVEIDDMWTKYRIPENLGKGMDTIIKDPHYSYMYAITKGKRFPEGEASISRNPELSLAYTENVLKGKRFPEGEASIAKNADHAMDSVILTNQRFEKGEPVLFKSYLKRTYAKFLKNKGIKI